MLDSFEVVLDPAARIQWPGGGCYQPAETRINGYPLIELVRSAEEPRARAEYLERLPEFENPQRVSVRAGRLSSPSSTSSPASVSRVARLPIGPRLCAGP